MYGYFARAMLAILRLGARPALADILWGMNGHPIASYPGVGIAEQRGGLFRLDEQSALFELLARDRRIAGCARFLLGETAPA